MSLLSINNRSATNSGAATIPAIQNVQDVDSVTNTLLVMSGQEFQDCMLQLLNNLGIENVTIIRHRKDGGFDAHGVVGTGMFCFSLGIRVLRKTRCVQLSDVNEFIGHIKADYPQGLFLTTSKFTQGALERASESVVPRMYTLNGSQIMGMI